MTRLRSTRAALSALSGGASLADALAVAAKAAETPGVRDELESARKNARDEVFRRETMERLPFDPPVVGVLLGRGRPENVANTARLALLASAPSRLRIRAVTYPFGVLFSTGAIVLLTNWVISNFLASDVPGVDVLTLHLANIVAGAAMLIAVFGVFFHFNTKLPVASAFLLLALLPVLPVYLLVEAIVGRDGFRRPLMGSEQILLWIAAGESAGITPGAMITSLLRGRLTIGASLRLRRLETKFRGVTRAGDALRTWADAGLPEPLRSVAGVELDGEDSVAATERTAKLASFLSPRVEPSIAIIYAGFVVMAFAVFLSASEVYAALFKLGATHVS